MYLPMHSDTLFIVILNLHPFFIVIFKKRKKEIFQALNKQQQIDQKKISFFLIFHCF